MFKVYEIYRRQSNGLSYLLDVLFDSRSAGYALAEYQSRYGFQYVYLKVVEGVNA